MWDNFLNWAFQTSNIPSTLASIVALTVGAAVAICSKTWKATRFLATWVHEASHALAAWFTGRRVEGMKIGRDTGGEVTHLGGLGRTSRIITSAAGYPGPAIAGLIIGLAVSMRHANMVALGTLIVALALLPKQRSIIGFLTTLLIGGSVTILILQSANPDASDKTGVWFSVLLLLLAGFFLAATPRTIIELRRTRHASQNVRIADAPRQHSDADILAEITLLPASVWEIIFMVLAAAAIITTLIMLMR